MEIKYCKYCGKECKNLNSLKQHECRCKNNPNRKAFDNLGNYARTKLKGQTKETSTHIQKHLESYYKNREKGLHNYNPHGGKASTEEKEILRRNHISKSMKLNPSAGGLRQGSGIGKKGKYKGYYCDSTYELVYIIYNLDNNIFFKRNKKYYLYEYSGEIHRYYPDFELEDGSLVEIKGYVTDKVMAKISSVKDVPINLLTYNNLKYAFDYVKNNYTYNKLTDLYDD